MSDLIIVDGRVFEVFDNGDTKRPCGECAGFGELPLCLSLPDCRGSVRYRELSSSEVQEAKKNGLLI